MPVITITPADFRALGPIGIVEKMEAAGFRFAQRACPFRLAGKFTVSEPDPETRAVSYTQEASPAGWVERRTGSFELETGALRLAVTDQRDRNCGWVWHISADGIYGGDTIEQGGHLDTADDAKRAGAAWARAFCEKTLAAIAAAEAS